MTTPSGESSLVEYLETLEAALARGTAIKHQLGGVLDLEWPEALDHIRGCDATEKLELAKAGIRLANLWCRVYGVDARTDQFVDSDPSPLEFDCSSVAILRSQLERAGDEIRVEWLAEHVRDLVTALET
jgi:hypothetical protein